MAEALKNKVAIITGGGRGIGAATARLFVAEGANIVITSRTAAELEQVAQSIQAEYGRGRVLAIPADVSDEEAVSNLFARSASAFGPLDILVNNAAIVEKVDFIDLDTTTWDKVMGVNVRGPFLCSREAFKQMAAIERGGAIVNMSSLSGIHGPEKFPGMSTYVVSKHAVVGLTEILAVEGKPLGIRANCIAPGAVDTVMLKKAAPFLKTSTTPEDVARTILFLADDNQSRHLNGAVIEIYSNE